MGCIYKIINKINGKIYIGQTVKTAEKRFIQHKNNSNKEYFSQIVLYKAFNRYGIENFKCETIEIIPNEQLDEREKYWIDYYDSYFNGYNSTLGGRATPLYNWDIEDVIEKYYTLKSARAVAKEIGCDHSTIDKILNANGVKRFTQAQILSNPVIVKKDGKEYHFETVSDAAQWFIDKKITKMTDKKLLRQSLTERIRKNKTYYDFEIQYESKRQSAPLATVE